VLKERGGVTAADVRTGEWQAWYDNGQLESVGSYAAGKKSGVWTHYYDNGKKKLVGTYTDGRLDSSLPWTEYNADGSVRDASGG
jgi:antitoxin component YwqK of YwqJK toxin-antitoxin module